MTETDDQKRIEMDYALSLISNGTLTPGVEGDMSYIEDRDGTRVYYQNTGSEMVVRSVWQGDTPVYVTPDGADVMNISDRQLRIFRANNPELYAALDAIDARVQIIGSGQLNGPRILE